MRKVWLRFRETSGGGGGKEKEGGKEKAFKKMFRRGTLEKSCGLPWQKRLEVSVQVWANYVYLVR